MPGSAGNALLRDRGNKSLRRRLSEGAPSRGAHAGDGFIVGGSRSRAETRLESSLLVVKSGGKEVSHIEKNSDLPAHGYLPSMAHGSTRTEMNVMRADSASQRARQGWHGRRRCSLVRCTVLMLSAERPKGERGATLAAACALFVSKLRQEPKGVNHGPFDQRPEWPAGSRTVALRRQHTHCRRSRGTSLATVH